MSWPRAILCGVLAGVVAAAAGVMVIAQAFLWLRYPHGLAEGNIVQVALALALALVLGATLLGTLASRRLGARRGLGGTLAAVALLLGGVGATAWLLRGGPPLVAGEPIALAIELRRRPGERPEGFGATVTLVSGTDGFSTPGGLGPGAAREEEGHWILPGVVGIAFPEAPRRVALLWDRQSLSYPVEVPARPAALDTGWSGWIEAESRVPAAPALRWRVQRRALAD